MPPWQGGGDMILAVTFERTTYNDLPYKFEAGTPHIAGAIGLGGGRRLPRGARPRPHRRRGARAARVRDRRAWRAVPGLAIIGTAPREGRGRLVHDARASTRTTSARSSTSEGVAIRTGHHCAMPVMEFFGVPATARASFAFYNTRAEIDRLVAALALAREVLG